MIQGDGIDPISNIVHKINKKESRVVNYFPVIK